MAQELCVIVSAEDRARLAAIIDDRNRPLKHVQRAKIILFSADRCRCCRWRGAPASSRPAVWRWQKRYAEAGVEGLLRDKTRPPGRTPVPTATVAQVLALTRASRPARRPIGPAGHGQGGRPVAAHRPAHLGSAPPAAASHPHLQTVQRSGLRREGRGRRRALHAPAGACRGAVDRRKIADPGARPHPARSADQARQVRDHDP